MSILYERLFALCQERGITAYRMCKDTGVQPSVMTDLKMGRRQTVKAETAAKIAAYFGVSVDYLLGNEEKPAAPKDSELDELVKDELVGFYGDVKKELTPGDIEDIKTLMKIRAELNRQKGK